MFREVLLLALTVAVSTTYGAGWPGVDGGRPQPGQAGRVYVSVANAAGAPVTGLNSADFVIKVNDRPSRVLDARRTSDPVALALIVSTSTNGLPRTATAALDNDITRLRRATAVLVGDLRQHSPQSRIGLVRAGESRVHFVPVAASLSGLDLEILQAADNDIESGIDQAANALRSEPAKRHVILVVATYPFDFMGGPALAQRLRGAHASLWSVQVSGFSRGGPSRTLTKLAALSGGREQALVNSVSLEQTVSQFAELLASEYTVTYEDNSGGELRVGVKGAGMSVAAPAWGMPDR